MAQMAEHGPMHQEVQGTPLGCGHDEGGMGKSRKRQPDSLSSMSLPPPL